MWPGDAARETAYTYVLSSSMITTPTQHSMNRERERDRERTVGHPKRGAAVSHGMGRGSFCALTRCLTSVCAHILLEALFAMKVGCEERRSSCA